MRWLSLQLTTSGTYADVGVLAELQLSNVIFLHVSPGWVGSFCVSSGFLAEEEAFSGLLLLPLAAVLEDSSIRPLCLGVASLFA